MAVQVDPTDVTKLMVGALWGAGVVFVLIILLNHVHGKAGAGVGVQ